MKKISIVLVFFFVMYLAGCDDIFEKDISEDWVNIISPKQKVVFSGNSVLLVWEPLEGAEEYHVVVVSPSFNNILLFRDTITERTQIELSLAEGSYQWSIYAYNFGYESKKITGSFEIKKDEE